MFSIFIFSLEGPLHYLAFTIFLLFDSVCLSLTSEVSSYCYYNFGLRIPQVSTLGMNSCSLFCFLLNVYERLGCFHMIISFSLELKDTVVYENFLTKTALAVAN